VITQETVRAWSQDPTLSGDIRFVIVDDWVLSGAQLVNRLKQLEVYGNIPRLK
jgi:hypothetical protein